MMESEHRTDPEAWTDDDGVEPFRLRRVHVAAIMVLAAGTGTAFGFRDCTGFTSNADALPDIGLWTALGLAALAIIGSLVYLVRWVARRRAPWTTVILSNWTLVLTALWLVNYTAGSFIYRADSCGL
jgi:hypothetical protein